MKKRAAFIDVDGTFLRKHQSSLLFHALVKQGVLKAEHVAVRNALDAYQGFRKGTHTWDEYDRCLMHVYYGGACFNGLDVQRVSAIAAEVIEEHGDMVHRFPRALLDAVRQDDYLPVFISGSPQVIVQKLAQRHLIHHWHGTTLPERDGRHTGEANEAWKYDKGPIVQRYAHDHDIDLKESIAIGDGWHDARMLELVSWAIMFNPSPTLKRYQIERKYHWAMVHELRSAITAFNYAGNMRIQCDIRTVLPRKVGEYVHSALNAFSLLE